MDLALRNASLIDGSGSSAVPGDLGIERGRIVALGKVEGRAKEEIDVQGAAVAPGFIDVHTHYDAQVFWDPMLTPSIFHGVTTVIAGNCGFTLAPLSGHSEDTDYMLRMLARVEGMPLAALRSALQPDWRSFGDYLDRLDGRLALNTAFMVGHSALRRAVMGARAIAEAATPDDIINMQGLLRRSLAEGGTGFSTSVSATHNDYEGNPVPSRFAERDEILALCSVTGELPGTWLGVIPGTMRFTEREYALTAEMSLTARRPLNWNVLMPISTQKDQYASQLGASDYAAARGARVYALIGSATPKVMLSFATGILLDLIPHWADLFKLPLERRCAALADPAVRDRMRAGLDEIPDSSFAMPFRDVERFVIETAASSKNRQWLGETMGRYAAAVGKPPFDALLDLAIEENLRLWFSYDTLQDDDESWKMRAAAWVDPRCIIGGSDAGAHLDMLNTFAFSTEFLANGVRRRKLVSLEEAVRRMTRVPADCFGLTARGRLEIGAFADIVVFDPKTVGVGPLEIRADLPAGESRIYAEAVGVPHVIVNGTPVVRDGKITGRSGGRVLRSGRDTHTVSI